MSQDDSVPQGNPNTFLTDPVYTFDCDAVPVPPGTMAPPRPPGKERPRFFTVVIPGNDTPAIEVIEELLQQIQRLTDILAADPAALEALRRAAAELAKIS